MKPQRCRLCLKDAELQDSHIVSKAISTRVRGSTDPIFLDQGTALRLSKQFKQPLLCRECEQLLSRDERTTIPLLADGSGGFPLFDRIVGARRISVIQMIPSPPTVDAVAISRFALSTFWRASTTSLPAFKNIDLGPHAEGARLHLLGSSWPAKMALQVTVYSPKPDAPEMLVLVPPTSSRRVPRCRELTFTACGVRFDLLVGAGIPASERQPCLAGGSTSPVFLVADSRALDFRAPAERQVRRTVARGKLAKEFPSWGISFPTSGSPR